MILLSFNLNLRSMKEVNKIAKDVNWLIPEVSKDLDISEDLVSKVIRFQWKELRNSLASISTYSFDIYKLGTFSVKTRQKAHHKQLRKLLDRIKLIERTTYTDDIDDKRKNEDILQVKSDIRNLLRIKNKIYHIIKEKKEIRNGCKKT